MQKKLEAEPGLTEFAERALVGMDASALTDGEDGAIPADKAGAGGAAGGDKKRLPSGLRSRAKGNSALR